MGNGECVSEIAIAQAIVTYVVAMSDNLMDGTGFRQRLFRAWTLYELKHGGELSQKRLGELVGELRGRAVGQSTVSDWRNEAIPSVEDLGWLAKALGCDPGWLAYGDESGAPPPDDPLLRLNYPIPPPLKP